MASFSQRQGLTPIRSLYQHADLDEETRTELWNVMHLTIEVLSSKYAGADGLKVMLTFLWTESFKKRRDERPYNIDVQNHIKHIMLQGDWNVALDTLEDFVYYAKETGLLNEIDFAEVFNTRFAQYFVPYQFVDGLITPIGSALEADAVSDAIVATDRYRGARHHIKRALELLADRQAPDYANSIKESISAVESVIKTVTKEETLGRGIHKLRERGIVIHPALEVAWSKMYGWTSNADGIRHAVIDAVDGDRALAKYMLVACSAFVTYLIEADLSSS
jgi:hypothetical protein